MKLKHFLIKQSQQTYKSTQKETLSSLVEMEYPKTIKYGNISYEKMLHELKNLEEALDYVIFLLVQA